MQMERLRVRDCSDISLLAIKQVVCARQRSDKSRRFADERLWVEKPQYHRSAEGTRDFEGILNRICAERFVLWTMASRKGAHPPTPPIKLPVVHRTEHETSSFLLEFGPEYVISGSLVG